jgi:exodeoxyribonuclease-3
MINANRKSQLPRRTIRKDDCIGLWHWQEGWLRRDLARPEKLDCVAVLAHSRPEVHEAYRRLVGQGWTDALRTPHLGERIYTFWKYFRNTFARDAGLRIGHFLLSPALADRFVSAEVDRQARSWEKSSDHAPVWIQLADVKADRMRADARFSPRNKSAERPRG